MKTSSGARRLLGYPETSEVCGLVRGGCFNHFQGGGSIYFSPGTGAWPVGGKIREAWARDMYCDGVSVTGEWTDSTSSRPQRQVLSTGG